MHFHCEESPLHPKECFSLLWILRADLCRLETLEEDRMLGSLVQDELKRQRAKAKETKQKNRYVMNVPFPLENCENCPFHGQRC